MIQPILSWPCTPVFGPMGGGAVHKMSRSLSGLLSRSIVLPTRSWYSAYHSGLNRCSTVPSSSWMFWPSLAPNCSTITSYGFGCPIGTTSLAKCSGQLKKLGTARPVETRPSRVALNSPVDSVALAVCWPRTCETESPPIQMRRGSASVGVRMTGVTAARAAASSSVVSVFSPVGGRLLGEQLVEVAAGLLLRLAAHGLVDLRAGSRQVEEVRHAGDVLGDRPPPLCVAPLARRSCAAWRRRWRAWR